jgi:glycerol-3-phosphate acyltransferase PlsY
MVKAAKAKDFPATKKACEAMLGHCNACHKKFEDGKHILTP